jgi:hypothetical protein
MRRNIQAAGVFNSQAITESALSAQLGSFETFTTSMQQGAIESFGLGTAIRGLGTDPLAKGDSYYDRSEEEIEKMHPRRRNRYSTGPSPAISEDEYKNSPNFRSEIPYESGMTNRRAEDLAAWYDAAQVRKKQLAQTPGWALKLTGSFTGQIFDPINYVPVLGPAARAAAVSKAGFAGGRIAVASADAAINTAIAGAATADLRGSFGDDVSFENLALEVSTAALIGAVFGSVGSVIGARRIKQENFALRNVGDAQRTLNEAVQSLVVDGELRLGEEIVPPLKSLNQASPSPFRADFRNTDTALSNILPDSDPIALNYEDALRQSVLKDAPELADEYRAAVEALERLQEIDAPRPAERAAADNPNADVVSAETRGPQQSSEAAPQGEAPPPSNRADPKKVAKAEEKLAEIQERIDVKARELADVEQSKLVPKTDPSRPAPFFSLPDPKSVPGRQAKLAANANKTPSELAEDFDVDPNTGEFPELETFKAMEAQDRLTKQEAADFEKASEIAERTENFNNALRQAAICELG